MARKPWQKISSRHLYHSSYLDLYRDKITDRLGKKANYYYIKKNPFVGIIPEDKKRNIYLVRQYRYTIRKFTWEIPMGSKRQGESYLDCAKRELYEEVSLKARRWTEIGSDYVTATVYPGRFRIYLAQDLEEIDKIPDPEEIDEVKKFSLKEIEKMIKENEIIGASVLASFHKYYLYKKFFRL